MGERRRWSGNLTTELSLCDNELDRLYDFAVCHKKIYILGAGKIGKGLAHYLKQAELPFIENITSEDLPDIKEEYKENVCGVIIGVRDGLLDEVIPPLKKFMKEEDIFLLSSEKRENMGEKFSVEHISKEFWVNVFVTNRCNLFCKSCSTYAPICKTAEDYDLEIFQKDIRQLRDLKLSTLVFFNFTGGEPFLHPELISMLSEARETFPEKNMNCYTNGLRIKAVSDEFLVSFRKLNVSLTITEYPIEGLELRESYERLDALGVKYHVIYSDGQKYFSKRPIKVDKSVKPYLYYYCPRYKTHTESLFLYRGTLSKCIYSFAGKWFNEAFGTNLVRTEADYVDLYHTTEGEIYDYCIKRLPYCGYCSPIEELIPWGLSERKIEEWT